MLQKTTWMLLLAFGVPLYREGLSVCKMIGCKMGVGLTHSHFYFTWIQELTTKRF